MWDEAIEVAEAKVSEMFVIIDLILKMISKIWYLVEKVLSNQ